MARQFFGLSIGLVIAAAVVSLIGVAASDKSPESRCLMPVAFWISTALLLSGSFTLQRAARHVRFQRLEPFRRWLVASLVIGTLFVGVQCSGLWQLIQNQTLTGRTHPESPETGANAFVVMVAGLHGVHFLVALLFVAWITVNAFANRYDHEYSWSVSFCAWFWHTLGIVWLAILSLFAAGVVTGFEAISIPDPNVMRFTDGPSSAIG
jgi:heme/copper-type cytochrome/quinol oxidase subunit 3